MSLRSKVIDSFRKISTKWSKTTQVILPGGSGVIWKPRNYETFAQEAYLTNVVAYRCIDAIAKAVESVEWLVEHYKKDGSIEEVTDHAVIELLYNPNPEFSWGELLYSHVAFGLISGNAYMEAITPDTGPSQGVPKELWSLRPDRMTVKCNSTTGIRIGYEYNGPNGQSVVWPVNPINGKSPIWHMRLFNPLNDFYGASPVEPTAREIDTANEATEWNKNLLQNSGRPGMIFSFKGNLGETEYNRLEKKLREKYSGPRNVNKNLILEGEGVEVKPYGFSPQEMDYIEGNRELARRICLGFGVPPMLLGIPGDNTYSNYQEARLAFWEDTVFFYLRKVSSGFSRWQFLSTDQLRLVPDFDSIPALEVRRAQQFDKAEKSNFLTVNEKRAMAGFESYKNILDANDKDDPANVIYQNASMVPLSDELPILSDSIEKEPLDEEDGSNESGDKEDGEKT